MTHNYFLGIDLGSVSLDLVVLDDHHQVQWSAYRQVQGRAREAVAALLRELLAGWAQPRHRTIFAGAMATGSGKEIIQELLGIPTVNEIVAHGRAAARLIPGQASVIEIGGQDSKFILIDKQGVIDYAMNELCAAGTGAFLDVQAERLGLTIAQLSTLAATAQEVPTLAGRCSVFAKSDIVHLQQQGVPLDQIVAGLCHALARNYVANLIRGREVTRPVIFQGGVALNEGVIRAFKHTLRLTEEEICRPKDPQLAGALGAALLARDEGLPLATAAIARAVASPNLALPPASNTHGWGATAPHNHANLESLTSLQAVAEGQSVFLGLDIGSISSNGVLLNLEGTVLATAYLLTAGDPLSAAQRVLTRLDALVGKGRIVAVGVTGSGRKLVGHALGADLVIDEITAQAKGAHHGAPLADTVIEIGGQDAKFIRIDELGAVVDFEMNKVCSAGTGSFIQEQAARLGVELKREYSELALGTSQARHFTSRCTVFMGSDLVHYIQQGVALPELLRGVSQAVVENYLDRVAQGRALGERIVLQGGVALNRSVVQAFRDRLPEATISVHPHPGESGAIGIALLAKEKAQATRPTAFASSFKGMNFPTHYLASSFACQGCENRCQVSAFAFADGRFHCGDLCGRYSETLSGFESGQDLSENIVDTAEATMEKESPHTVLGIPRALLALALYPFWRDFFAALGIPTLLSPPSSNDILALALARLPAETCLPVKLLFGHVAALEKAGVKQLFLPTTDKREDGVSCPYIQHAAAMVQANFTGIETIALPLQPALPDREHEQLTRMVGTRFGVNAERVAAAYEAASLAFSRGQEAKNIPLADLPRRPRPLAVLFGKPYTRGDRFLNIALSAKLAKAGFDVIAEAQLHVPEDFPLPPEYNSIAWVFSRRMLHSGAWLNRFADIYPVVLGTFGCGPDAFTLPLLAELFAHRPSLFLEFDEHRADAGLATRIEAFAHRVGHWRTGKEKLPPHKTEEASPPPRLFLPHPAARRENHHYIIPYFSDHSRAFHGAFAGRGYSTQLLPLPDRRSYDTGVELAGGKQCHPFLLLAGDLVNLARAGELRPNSRYILPTMDTSCMYSQYVPTMQGYLDKLGRGDVKVLSLGSAGFLAGFGPLFVYNLGKAILGIEYLSRVRFALRPYEKEPGRVNQAYQAGLELLHQGQLKDGINQGIQEASRILNQVATHDRGGKPVIAIAGDAYTRANESANHHLFSLLEELGCEVWPAPPLIDAVLTGRQLSTRKHRESGQFLEALSSWGWELVNNFASNAILKNFTVPLPNPLEASGEETAQYIDGLLPGHPELLVVLNVAKHVDFARKGVDGILNVYCLNCQVGTVTTALFKSLTSRTGGIPMMPLVFDAMGGTHVKNRVEAFVHRVLRHRQEGEAGKDGKDMAPSSIRHHHPK